MESSNLLTQKAKPIILGLTLLVIISLFFVFATNAARQADLKRFKHIEMGLRQENSDLTKKYTSAQQQRKALEEKYNTVQRDLDRVSRERDEFKQKYDLAIKEREDLIEKMKRLSAAEPASLTSGALAEDVYWANVLKEKANLEVQLKDFQEQLRILKIRIDEVGKDKQDLALEVSALTQAKIDLERQLGYNNKLISSISADLVREKTDKKMIAGQLAKAKEENGFLRRKLHETATAKINLQNKIQTIESEREMLKNRVTELDQIMQDRMEDLIQIKRELELSRAQAQETSPSESGDVELPPIVVRSSKERSLRADSLYGQILSVNKENDFVIVDLGETSGVVPGQEYRVYQDNQNIANIVVIQTRRDISAAGIKDVKSGYEIRVGDLVK